MGWRPWWLMVASGIVLLCAMAYVNNLDGGGIIP